MIRSVYLTCPFQTRSLQLYLRRSFLDQKLFNQDHYEVLGVKQGSNKEDIKKQYYKLTKQFHPDINKGNEEKFKQINSAWDVLGDDKKRSEYDTYKGFFGQGGAQNTQQAQGFNPFTSTQNDFGRNPFHEQGAGQNPFGQGSPFGDVDLDQMLKDLKKTGIKIDDFENHPHFKEFNQMFGLNQKEPKGLKDKIAFKLKQEAMKFMLRKVQDRLEKEIIFHQQKKDQHKYGTRSSSSSSTSSTQGSRSQHNQSRNSYSQSSQAQQFSDMFTNFFKKK